MNNKHLNVTILLNGFCLEIRNNFLSDLVSEFWVVRYIEVKFHLGASFSVHFTGVSALECRVYRGNLT